MRIELAMRDLETISWSDMSWAYRTYPRFQLGVAFERFVEDEMRKRGIKFIKTNPAIDERGIDYLIPIGDKTLAIDVQRRNRAFYYPKEKLYLPSGHLTIWVVGGPTSTQVVDLIEALMAKFSH